MVQLRVHFQLWKKGNCSINNLAFLEKRSNFEDFNVSNSHQITISKSNTEEKLKDESQSCIEKERSDDDSSYLTDFQESLSPISVSENVQSEKNITHRVEAFNLKKDKSINDNNDGESTDFDEVVKSSDLVLHYSMAGSKNVSSKLTKNDSEIMSKELFEEREYHNKLLLEYEQRLQQIEECMSSHTSFMGDAVASTQISNHLNAFLKAEEEKKTPEVDVKAVEGAVKNIKIEGEKKIKRSKNVRRRSRINRAINCQNSFATNKIV